MGVTLKQIAEIAGVSRGTVDRALHGRGRVNSAVAERISEIANELGYRPNRMGRALAMARKTIRIGVIVQSCETPFMQMVIDGIKRAHSELHELGAEVITEYLESVDSEQMLDAINRLMEKGVQALALTPTDDGKLRSRMNALMVEEQIPVIAFNSDITDTKRMCFVGLDNIRSGQTCAGLMALALQGSGKVLPLTGHLTNYAHKQRLIGFLGECERSFPDIEVLSLQPCFDKDDYAYELTMHALLEHPDLSGIFVAANGQSGVCRALVDSQKKAQVCHIAYDLTPQNRQNLLDGNIDIVIGQGAFEQGYRPPILLYNYLLNHMEPEQEYLYTDILIKTKYNL